MKAPCPGIKVRSSLHCKCSDYQESLPINYPGIGNGRDFSMVYPVSRSMNGALNEGATDGKYKKVVADRDLADTATYNDRRDLSDAWNGIHETPDKVNPGSGRTVRTPNYVPTSTAERDF